MTTSGINHTTFLIGGATISVPPLNLKAQRLAMKLLPAAFGSKQPDEMLGVFIQVLSARLESTATPMTADEIETRIEGKDELIAFGDSMRALLNASGFSLSDPLSDEAEEDDGLPGEVLTLATTPPAPAADHSVSGVSIQTLSTDSLTASSAPLYESGLTAGPGT